MADSSTTEPAVAASLRRPWPRFMLFAAGLSLCFARPLLDLVRYAATEELHSHILLVPFISLYLVWTARHRLPASSRSAPWTALVLFLAGLGVLAIGWAGRVEGRGPNPNDWLSWTTASYLCLLAGGAVWAFGKDQVKAVLFPVLFLLFMIPLPSAATHAISFALQWASAGAADLIFRGLATPLFREGMVFHLPGVTVEVGEECSGIRSSLVLFMTCLLAGHLFLNRSWGRTVLALVVIPLGILRNALRIVVISLLCIHVHPDMINSPLHTRGGPVFFVVSLVPLFLLLFWLRKAESRKPNPTILDRV